MVKKIPQEFMNKYDDQLLKADVRQKDQEIGDVVDQQDKKF
jgi:hypothetical protein